MEFEFIEDHNEVTHQYIWNYADIQLAFDETKSQIHNLESSKYSKYIKESIRIALVNIDKLNVTIKNFITAQDDILNLAKIFKDPTSQERMPTERDSYKKAFGDFKLFLDRC